MTPIAAMVVEMMARGVPADVIALAVSTAEQAMMSTGQSAEHPVDAATERRRAYDRERQRKVRELRRQSADNPPMSQEALTLSSLPIKEEGNSKKEGKKERARKIPLSADWQPSEVHFEVAAKLGVPREAVLNKAEDMRIWAGSNGSLKKDWDLTFHGFLRRDAPKLAAQSNGKSYAKAAPNGLAQALGRLKQHIGTDDRGEVGSGPSPRLLSHG